MARSHILRGFSDLESALWLHKYHSGLTIKEMVNVALENGYTITDTARYEIAQLLHEWGLADKENRTLTTKGEAFDSLWEIKRNVAIDVLHGLQYGLWTRKTPNENIASWAYKMICDYLWETQTLPESKELASYVSDLRAEYEDMILIEDGKAFRGLSILNAYDWLLPLDPPVLHGVSVGSQAKSFKSATFERRQFCSTELFVMGLAYIVREDDNQFGDLVKIDDDRKRAICSFCLIEETSFDMMLNDALRKASYISLQKEWDIYVVINREPQIADFSG